MSEQGNILADFFKPALHGLEARKVTCEGDVYVNLADVQAFVAENFKRNPPQAESRPKIICLCGSTRFIEQFAIRTWELELEGHIVLGCTLLPQWYCPVRHHFAEHQGVKPQRDEHHLRKIDLADEILVLNIGGYIGESTRNEIAYAQSTGKPVRYVERPVDSIASEVIP